MFYLMMYDMYQCFLIRKKRIRKIIYKTVYYLSAVFFALNLSNHGQMGGGSTNQILYLGTFGVQIWFTCSMIYKLYHVVMVH